MENVELVIKIPEERYNQILDKDYILGHYLEIAVRNGTLLPKGHGRLIDADYITKDLNTLQDSFTINMDNANLGVLSIGCNAHTIIEADTESEGKNDKAIKALNQKWWILWHRLYSWLADMRLCIAPDETVTDIDERNVRTAQVDLLDEIMEWMDKSNSSGNNIMENKEWVNFANDLIPIMDEVEKEE